MGKSKGYFGIGCINMKSELNYGTLFRSAGILGADFMFLIGRRFNRMPSDVNQAWRSVPLYEYANLEDFCGMVEIQNVMDYDMPQWKGIPLTAGVWKAAGFEWVREGWGRGGLRFEIVNERELELVGVGLGTRIQYVHELQNICWVLKGWELELGECLRKEEGDV